MIRNWGFRSLLKRGIERLPFSILYEAFYQSGRALGVGGYEVIGDVGTIIGPFNDQTIMKQYLRTRAFSPIIGKLFRDFFQSRGGGSFYDIGANIGMITVPVAQNQAIRCVAFEPDRENFTLLRANVAMNCRHDNVEMVNAAVAKDRGKLRFTRSEYNSGDHRLSQNGSLIVDTVRLDDYAPTAMPLAVKIDCQGAEPLIFAGGTQTLANAELVVCEFWPWGIRRMGLSPEPVVNFVAENFPFVQVLRHNEQPGIQRSVKEALPLLRKLVDDGSEYADVDLVLTKSNATNLSTT